MQIKNEINSRLNILKKKKEWDSALEGHKHIMKSLLK